MGFHKTLFIWVSLVALFSHNLILTPLAAASDSFLTQKCSDPPHHAPHPPKGHHGGGGKTPPSHGGGCSCSCPPSTPPPSPGGCSPSTPTTPPSGGYHPPSTPVHIPPPSPIVTPITPVTPVTPITPVTPVTPVTPITPVAPSPPTPFDPGSGPFPCNFWGSHPALIFGVLGWWATLGGVFGPTSLPGGFDPTSFSLQQALTNNRPDAYGSLLREGTAAFLNSMAAPKGFPFTTAHVKQAFTSALSSDKAAASQARLFRLANEGKLKLS